MSHGASSEGSACEPNLTPMLDLVLQILMFFMVTANLSAEQTQEDVQLPESQTARALPKTALKDPLFLNLLYNEKAQRYEVTITGNAPKDQIEAKKWIQKQFEDLKRFSGGEVNNPV